ncbi:MAG: monomethylamine:corrinoid methyltransferase [Chloroflexi bacterium]|nr:monomethylamine:corrinoid methyltransferase [Chloroflexota bacterium]
MSVTIWDVLQRCREGERMEEKAFDMSIFRATSRLVKEFEIKYDPQNPVPQDDAMADRLFQAALEFFVQVGTFCVDTGRVIKVTRREVEEKLEALPSEEMQGAGAEAFRMVHRTIGGKEEPFVGAGIQTAIFSSDEMAFKIYKGCAEDLCVNAVNGGVATMVDDKYDVIAGTPAEIYGYRKNIEILRRAVADAGRPGLVVVNNAPKAIGTIGMVDEQHGIRRSDGLHSSGVAEMKVNYDDLDRAVYAIAAGFPLSGGCPTIIGGFSGSIEGAAIVSVAGALQGITVHQATRTGCNAIPGQIKSKATREVIWVTSLGVQALTRNTHGIYTGSAGDHPAAGPGTMQYFYECAAGVIANTVSGGHRGGGTRKFRIGRTPDFGTPLESRWLGEVAKAVPGMDRAKANAIVNYLLAKYEPHLKEPPDGQTYHELYDVASEVPKPEYLRLYRQAKEELAGLGVAFR